MTCPARASRRRRPAPRPVRVVVESALQDDPETFEELAQLLATLDDDELAQVG